MEPFVLTADDEAGTERLGRALASGLPSGAVVALIGTLGAGKTRLVQAFAAAHGVPRDETTSPTFVLMNQYRGRVPIYHIDAYRLRDEDEFLELGPEEYFESSGVTFIEWADRVANCLPAERIEIHCEVVSEKSRRFTVSATSARLESVVKELKLRLKLVPRS